MRIGIIGAGLIGKTLAVKFSAASHQVTMADAKGVESIQSIANLSGEKAVPMETVTDQIDLLVISVPIQAYKYGVSSFYTKPNSFEGFIDLARKIVAAYF